MITIDDIKSARDRIYSFINETPILSSSLLNNWIGHEIFFKTECFQKIGAFKARGACNTISWLIENNLKPERIITNSSGNHAQAVAWAAQLFKIPSTIFMPVYSSKVKIQATKSYGAQIELCENRNVADEKVKLASKQNGNYWIPPFNHNQVISGQGTIMLEALNQTTDIDAVFAACGGGGLLSGTIITTHALSPKTKIIGVEPLNANDAAQSLRMNTIQKLPSVPNTIADGAMTMEGVVQWLKKQKAKRRVMVILSGGNIDYETQLKIWRKNYLDIRPSN